MEYEEALTYMQGLIRFGWKLGNDRFTALCARLGCPQDRYHIVHVAGTKGKGSTTALSAAILRESGYSVGAYYSPYVYDVRERVQVDGSLISKSEFAALVTEARPQIESLAATELGQATEFELKTLVGFLHFARRAVDYACIEVGIGGRLDATNIVSPTVTVITNIGLDHTHILGDTHELIAAEKAGIIKCGVPCVTAVDHAGALDVISDIASDRGAPLIQIARGAADSPTCSAAKVRWDFWSEGGAVNVATCDHVYHIPTFLMRGSFQKTNAACAIAAAELALRKTSGGPLPEAAVQRAIAGTSLPGRMATVPLDGGRLVVLDGAHNALAAESIREPLAELKTEYELRRTLVVLGMLSGHDADAVAGALLAGAHRAFVCSPQWKRAMPAEELADTAGRYVSLVDTIPDVRQAVSAALQASEEGDMILITGSFYTVGEVSPHWIVQAAGEQKTET